MPKRNWLLSLVVSVSLWGVTSPVLGQALLPYTPDLNAEQLEEQGLELVANAIRLLQMQQYEPAISHAKLATQLAPKTFQSWFILGSLYLQKQEIDQSIAALETALSLVPEKSSESAGIMFTLGNAYFQKGDYQRAASELEAGLKIKPNTPAALFDLGNSYLKLAKLTDAIASYEKAVKQEKDFWPAINNLGLIRYEQGNIEGAIKNWQAAIAIDDQQAEPRLATAVALYQQGKREQGLKLGESALAINVEYADLKFLKENLWGEKLLRDTKAFLDTPPMQALIVRLQAQPQEEQVN